MLMPAQLDVKSKNEIQNFDVNFHELMCLGCLDVLETLRTMFILTTEVDTMIRGIVSIFKSQKTWKMNRMFMV